MEHSDHQIMKQKIVGSSAFGRPGYENKLVDKLQQTCRFYQVATSLLKSGLFQLVICRLVKTC